MILTIMDFETNGLIRKNQPMPKPLSCSYIQVKAGTYELVESGTMYFYNPELIKHSLEAEAINGLTESFLMTHKDNFSANVRKLFKIMAKGNLIGHNMEHFDAPVGFRFLSNLGYVAEANTIEDTLKDLLHVFKRRTSLVNTCKYFGIPDSFIAAMHKVYFGEEPKETWHTASWDTVATFLCYRAAKNKKLM